MKTFIGILMVICSISTFAQFPEPTGFDFSYEYIMMDQSGYCAGQWVNGPTYCSHFSWAVPDTNSTTATLEYYNLYYDDYGAQDTTILTATTDTYFDIEIGILGEIWVTAVYSNPDGESEPSNKIINEELPIAVEENILQNELNVLYDVQNQRIIIANGKGIAKINLFNSQGKLIESETKIYDGMHIDQLQKGLYVIEILSENREVKRLKIISVSSRQ